MIFVIGCGRTGTCLMGYILRSHPEVRCFIESARFFGLATRIALGERALLPELIERYRQTAVEVAPLRFADKSRPNLWQVEELLEAFPEAKFMAMLRDAKQTVSSMLHHAAFVKRERLAAENPQPRRFLGITEDNAEWYRTASDCERLTLQWKVHTQEIERLWETMPLHVQAVRYEDLVTDPEKTLKDLQLWLGLNEPFPPPNVRTNSLSKWETQLTSEQVCAIEGVA